MNQVDIEKAIHELRERNSRVETDKAWEISTARKTVLAIFTYIVALLFLTVIQAPNAFINALIPTAGFLLSTLSLPWFKKKWIDSQTRK